MQWWPEEVHVAVSNGTSVVVRSTERAAELLLCEWRRTRRSRGRPVERACGHWSDLTMYGQCYQPGCGSRLRQKRRG